MIDSRTVPGAVNEAHERMRQMRITREIIFFCVCVRKYKMRKKTPRDHVYFFFKLSSEKNG